MNLSRNMEYAAMNHCRPSAPSMGTVKERIRSPDPLVKESAGTDGDRFGLDVVQS